MLFVKFTNVSSNYLLNSSLLCRTGAFSFEGSSDANFTFFSAIYFIFLLELFSFPPPLPIKGLLNKSLLSLSSKWNSFSYSSEFIEPMSENSLSALSYSFIMSVYAFTDFPINILWFLYLFKPNFFISS